MMEKYKNKYRMASARAQWWDYGWNGAYFITICTKNREHFFGQIIEKQFIASIIGQLAATIWYEIPNKFSFVELGDFVVMPNHIHGILILNKPDKHNEKHDQNNINDLYDVTVERQFIASLQLPLGRRLWVAEHNQTQTGGFAGNKNPMINHNVSRLIRWYKARCSFEIRKIRGNFAWQSLFHDHIIRNNTEYARISTYIMNNPANWNADKFYSS
jgi:REP element-mobilizing transposase RayT